MAVPSNGDHLTLENVKRESVVRESIYEAPTRVISLENASFNGTTMPLRCPRPHPAVGARAEPAYHIHLDGRCLWEAVAAGAFKLRGIGECFDSI